MHDKYDKNKQYKVPNEANKCFGEEDRVDE